MCLTVLFPIFSVRVFHALIFLVGSQRCKVGGSPAVTLSSAAGACASEGGGHSLLGLAGWLVAGGRSVDWLVGVGGVRWVLNNS